MSFIFQSALKAVTAYASVHLLATSAAISTLTPLGLVVALILLLTTTLCVVGIPVLFQLMFSAMILCGGLVADEWEYAQVWQVTAWKLAMYPGTAPETETTSHPLLGMR
jgi:hypothetical protein